MQACEHRGIAFLWTGYIGNDLRTVFLLQTLFLENISYARYVDYDLSVSVDMEKLRTGVKIALENLTNSAVLDTNDHRMICSNNMEFLSEAEKIFIG